MNVPAAQARFQVAADHPCLPGHFPGRPIVPGVLLLELAAAALRECWPQLGPLRELRWAKFLAPVNPGETVEVSAEKGARGLLRFSCSTAAGIAVRGEFAFAPPPAGPAEGGA
jgi:3-hydroxymyristoyl/3-hydroxydecanoyl-(acyl carrier protein) dehydratase